MARRLPTKREGKTIVRMVDPKLTERKDPSTKQRPRRRKRRELTGERPTKVGLCKPFPVVEGMMGVIVNARTRFGRVNAAVSIPPHDLQRGDVFVVHEADSTGTVITFTGPDGFPRTAFFHPSAWKPI